VIKNEKGALNRAPVLIPYEPTVRYERTQAFQAFSLDSRSRPDVLFHSADRAICRDRITTMSHFAALNPDSNPDPRVRFVIHKPPVGCSRLRSKSQQLASLRQAPQRAVLRSARTASGQQFGQHSGTGSAYRSSTGSMKVGREKRSPVEVRFSGQRTTSTVQSCPELSTTTNPNGIPRFRRSNSATIIARRSVPASWRDSSARVATWYRSQR